MAIYVYITKKCEQDSTQLNKANQVQAFADRIRASQEYEAFFEHFHPTVFKKPINNLRLLAEAKSSGDDIVIVFRRLVTRGGGEYKQFKGSGYLTIPGTSDENEISDQALAEYIKTFAEAPPSPAPEPSTEEAAYLHTVLATSPDLKRDHHCCETSMWVNRMLEERFTNRVIDFSKAVFDTIDSNQSEIQELRCEGEKEFGILYRSYPEWKMVVLLTPFKGEAPYDEVKNAYPDIAREIPTSREEIIRLARRAYPHALLLTPDAWAQVQKEKEGNMALSEEEIDVLESARAPQGGYPLFINGRAGSGKSTILQYLFAEYAFHAVTQGFSAGSPVFFACNDELLARCSSGVKALVQGMFSRAEGAKVLPEADFSERLDQCCQDSFKNFHKWLHSLVPDEEFPLGRRIDYGKFKFWWEENFSKTPSARKIYGPDISWHVIRTYVKGSDTDHIVDPDDYEEQAFSTKQNSVTVETYRIVFENVWSRYQRSQEADGIWDDQDVARHVIQNQLIPDHHTVVFCDEAQDFTRIELEVLHRHSLFSRRTVKPYEQPMIPFAFAGDPFQTLNPTGFHWDSTKAFFTDKFIKKHPGQPRKDLNYCELTYNYRSSAPIVHFCNTLQLLRKVLFNLYEITPQLPWADNKDLASVVYFSRSDHDALRKLKEQSDIRIIVPCEEGEEASWSKENGLSDYVEFDDSGVPKNVASATRVKGLEFPRIVLFGFGDGCPPSLKRALHLLDVELQGDASIEPQYYLNRLYVAASRPSKRLFVIDSDESIRGFWVKLFDSSEDMMLRVRDHESWTEVCGEIRQGTSGAWEGDEEDPLEAAEALAKDARLRKDPYLFRQAAQYFSSAGKTGRSAECRAEALELESQFLDAAKEWKGISRVDRSLRAAWKAGRSGDKFIIELGNASPELKNRPYYRFACHLQDRRSLNEGAQLLKDLADWLVEGEFRDEVFTESAWRTAVLDCLKGLLESKESTPTLWGVCYDRSANLHREGLAIPPKTLGELAFRGGRLKEAYAAWERVEKEERVSFEGRFLRAKAAGVDYPDSLEVYGDLLGKDPTREAAELVVELVENHPNIGIQPAQRDVVVRAAIIAARPQVVYDNLEHMMDESLLLDHLSKLISEGSDADKDKLLPGSLRRWFEVLGSQGRWDDVVRACASGEIPRKSVHSPSERMKHLGKWLKVHPTALRGLVTNLVVETPAFEMARNDHKTLFSRYLRDNYTTDFSWHGEIHPLVVGRAFERAGLFKETLPYYEAVAAHEAFSDELHLGAWQRWIRAKFEHAKREAEISPKKAEKIEGEAFEVARKYRIKTDNISAELPKKLPRIIKPRDVGGTSAAPEEEDHTSRTGATGKPTSSASSSKTFRTQVTCGKVEIRVSKNGTRINFEHVDTGEQAHITVDPREARFEATAVEFEDDLVKFDPWEIEVRFSPESGRLYIEVADGTEISLRIASVPASGSNPVS
mgnify:CR=1 FL=1